jgi:hypothetical protein
VSYSVYGERGSIDLLAWHPAIRTLLVIEVKTEVSSVEAMLRKHDEKVRLAPRVAAERFDGRQRLRRACLCCRICRLHGATSTDTIGSWRTPTRCVARRFGRGSARLLPAAQHPGSSSCHLRKACVVDPGQSVESAFGRVGRAWSTMKCGRRGRSQSPICV